MTTVADPLTTSLSTIVRFFRAPRSVRAGFWMLERTAPALGARLAERVWFTIPRRFQGPRDGIPAGGVSFTTSMGGHLLRGVTWGAGPLVYLVHGWAGNGGQLAAFVAPLVARGHRVVMFDLPSHGASGPGAFGPRSSNVLEFARALDAVIAAHGPARAIIAHSLGATAAAIALCDGQAAGRVAFVSPMASVAAHGRQFARAMGFGDRIHRRLITRVERRVGAPLHHFDVPELGRAVAMPPTLIIHDRDDRSTPVSDGAAIAAAWPGARLHMTSGLGHQRILRDPAVVAQIVDFVADRP
jgi:pimeloyl-ACP methyl ester carboxylesterase